MSQHGDDVQLVTFRCGGHDFAFDILQLQRILRYEAPRTAAQRARFPRGRALL